MIIFDQEMRGIVVELDLAVTAARCLCNGENGIDPCKLRSSLTSIEYTLLSRTYTDSGRELCRLGLVVLVATLISEMPQGRTPGCNNLWIRIRELLREQENATVPFGHAGQYEPIDVQLLVEFRLWMMFLAAGGIADDQLSLKNWYLSAIATTATSLLENLHISWNDIEPRVTSFLFVPAIHGRIFEYTWERSREFVPIEPCPYLA